MKKIYIVGSSSKLAESISRLASEDYVLSFFGRSNPYQLKPYTYYEGIDSEESVSRLNDLIVKDVALNKTAESVGLIILPGVSTNDWRESFLVNEYLPAKLSEEFANAASAAGIKRTSIVLVSSSAAYQGSKLAYATTKASLTGVLHTIAKDFRGRARINIILPSAFDSGMISDWDDDKRNMVAQNNYIGRLGTADDMADAILFAIRNEFIDNSIINMSGGTVVI